MSLEPKNKKLTSHNWQPTASIENLKKRAEITHTIRAFFYAKNITEVETPILNSHAVTDAYLDSLKLNFNDTQTGYLHTSPEYCMKRLLAAGLGNCYQITKAFRNHEQGKQHHTEFSLLEWYRLGFNHHDLMTEMNELLQLILNTKNANKISYQNLFENYLSINPHTASIKNLQNIAKENNLLNTLGEHHNTKPEHKDDWLMLLLSALIEPKLGFNNTPVFIYDYPASQAALAKIAQPRFSPDQVEQAKLSPSSSALIKGPKNNITPVAERFEVYINGIELANGFHELQDYPEQKARFEKDLELRKSLSKFIPEIDRNFLAALEHGLPNCSGVALGIDRLISLALETESIKEVMSFLY